MKITGSVLLSLGVSFKALFAGGLAKVAPTQIDEIAMRVPSTTAANEYGWLGELPDMREWIGDRVINQFEGFGYSIKNKDWEQTVRVKRTDIEDDNVGLYNTRFSAMGRSTASHPAKLVWGALLAGFSTLCYDGQFFFDTDHPVLDAAGVPQSVANMVAGAGAAWFLVDDSTEMKPIIFQERKQPEFTAKDNPNDDNVFMRKEFLYGVDGRYNVGYGLWQLCFASKADLTPDNFGTLFSMMESQTGDYARPLGITPKKLFCGPSNRKKAMTIINAEQEAAGATNVWKDVVELVIVPWLP